MFFCFLQALQKQEIEGMNSHEITNNLANM
jgi:hypothetical protein